MSYDEALAWLRGERSTINMTHAENPAQEWEIAHRQDAAATEQAYWVVRAHKEGLVDA